MPFIDRVAFCIPTLAFLDYEKSAALIFAEYMAMMGLWVFIAFYVSKVLGKLSATKFKRKRGEGARNESESRSVF